MATALLVLVGLLAACTQVEDPNKKAVRLAILANEQAPRSFTYTETLPNGQTTTVTGTIVDDLRYRLDAQLNGGPTTSMIVNDDSIAYNIADGRLVPNAPAGLSGKGWEVDRKAAASLLVAATSSRQLGADPMLDALLALQYVQDSANKGGSVSKYVANDLNYRPKFDPFVTLDQHGRPADEPPGITRYIVNYPPLPIRQQGSGQGSQSSLPGNDFFRNLSIYIEDGKVIEVKEDISVLLRLEDPTTNLEARIDDYGNIDPRLPLDLQAHQLVADLNDQLIKFNQPPVRERTLDIKFGPTGDPSVAQIPSTALSTDFSSWIAKPGVVLYETS